MGGRVYTYRWRRGRWEADCIPIAGEEGDCIHIAGEEGDRREIVYLLLGKREIVYISLHCHHQNDSCVKMDSDESHFNVSLVVRDKVTRQRPQTTTFLKRTESCGRIKLRPFYLPLMPA